MPVESPQHLTLGPGAESVVNFAYAYEYLEVVNVDGTAAVYFTMDGTTPVVGATGTEVLPAAISSLSTYRASFFTPGGGRVVKLISDGSPKVSVAGRYKKSRSS